MGLVYDIVNQESALEEAKAFAKRLLTLLQKRLDWQKLSSTNLSIMTTKLF